MRPSFISLLTASIILSIPAFAQSGDQTGSAARPMHLKEMLGSGKIRVVNRMAEPLGGDTNGVRIQPSKDGSNGLLWLKDVPFREGEINFDVQGKNVPNSCFVGIAFHGVNDSTYEGIYFRPFNFHATDSLKKLHMVEYICEPTYPWWVLRRDFPGQYEKSLHPVPEPEDWFHVRITVRGKEIAVFVNGADTASLIVTSIQDLKGSMLGLWDGSLTSVAWSGLSIRADR
jgi:hypothetical protein